MTALKIQLAPVGEFTPFSKFIYTTLFGSDPKRVTVLGCSVKGRAAIFTGSLDGILE